MKSPRASQSWKLVLLLAGTLVGCNVPAALTPPATITVSIASPATTVEAGHTVQFTATLGNTTNTNVIWEVNGAEGGSSAVGTITTTGLYTAPAVPPTPATVTILAAAAADTSISTTTTLTINPAVGVTVSPATASVQTGSTFTFTAAVSNATDKSVTWSVNGVAGGNAASGTISNLGVYTAPATVPVPATVNVTASANAEPAKTGTAVVTVTAPPPVIVSVTPTSAALQTGASQQFTASVVNTTNTAVTWEVAGIAGGNATVGLISSSGYYTAPSAVPNPATVVVSAVSQADASVMGTATVTLTQAPPPVSVSISPTMASAQVNGTQAFVATVLHAADSSVTWQVNGVTGGNAVTGTISTAGEYTAPVAVPSPATVTVTALSNQDMTKSASATVTIEPTISVMVTPNLVNVLLGQSQQFTANVSNASNQGVVWSVAGASCTGMGCGTISQAGLYTAPQTLPTPNASVQVTATSVANSAVAGVATVNLTPVPVPTVTISGGPLELTAAGTYTYTASVSIDPQSQGVTWTATCLAEGHDETRLDCVAPKDYDGDGDYVTVGTTTSTTIQLTLPSLPTASYAFKVQLTATSVQLSTGGTAGTASITISAP